MLINTAVIGDDRTLAVGIEPVSFFNCTQIVHKGIDRIPEILEVIMVIPGAVFEQNEFVNELVAVNIVAIKRSVYIFFYNMVISPNPD